MGLTLGPLFAVNLLGMLTTRANWQGAAVGLAAGVCTIVWILTAAHQCGKKSSHNTTTTTTTTTTTITTASVGGLLEPGGFFDGIFGGGGHGHGDAGCTGAMRIGQVTFYWYGTILCLMTFSVGMVVRCSV
jgi:hypothetical protein